MHLPVFISKSVQEVPTLQHFLKEREIPFIGHSFLSFEQVDAVIPNQFDCIFFGSPRSIIFYFSQSSIPSDVKIACSGEKTATALKQLGYTPDFIAEKSGNVSASSRQFAEWAKQFQVLFPLSQSSHKSYTQFLEPKNILEVIVYRTIITSKAIEPCGIYIFSSPSNVEGFLKENDFQKGAKIIAWGETTAKAISTLGYSCNFVLESGTEQEIIECLSNSMG